MKYNRFMGEYDPNTEYEKLDVVTFGGDAYYRTKAGKGVSPIGKTIFKTWSKLSQTLAEALNLTGGNTGTGLPSGGEPNQYMVTDELGNPKWEKNPVDVVTTVVKEEDNVSGELWFEVSKKLAIGSTLQVYLDGVVYNTVYESWMYDNGYDDLWEVLFAGNKHMYDEKYEDSGEPFYMQFYPDGSSKTEVYLYVGYEQPHNVKIVLIEKKIEESYLPDSIKNVQPNWNQYDKNAEDYVKNRPCYIDNVELHRITNPDANPNYGGISEVQLDPSLTEYYASMPDVIYLNLDGEIFELVALTEPYNGYKAWGNPYMVDKNNANDGQRAGVYFYKNFSSYLLRFSWPGNNSTNDRAAETTLYCVEVKALDPRMLGLANATITPEDNGKVLAVVDGAFKLVTLAELQS